MWEIFENLNIIVKYYIIQKFLDKNAFFVFLVHFYCFPFKTTPNSSFKYFESSDVIIVKKKVCEKFHYFYVLTRVKKDKMVGSRAPGCANRADKNSDICYYNCIAVYSEPWHSQNS